MVRTRFAPSPTGYLHIGGVRTALFNWLFAREQGGQFVLRIDDTDVHRNVAEALAPILDGLRWLGIEWDEGPDVGGPYAPYYQSQRTGRYQAAIDQLVAAGAAYFDYARPEEIELQRERAQREKRHFVYDRRWMATTDQERRQFEAQGRQRVVRLKMPRQGKLELNDLVRGQVQFDWEREQDHIVQRADGSFLYHLATVVDDHDFQITHVIRAEEHLSNTPRQHFIAQSLGYVIPQFAHLPYVAEPGSKDKLSKRKLQKYLKHLDFAQINEQGQSIAAAVGLKTSSDTFNPVIVDFYRAVGYLPDAIVNYLLLLGWSLDDKTEFFTRDEMVRQFSLQRVNKAPASFDPKKLMAFQQHYMQQLPPKQKVACVLPFLQKAGLVSSPPPCQIASTLSAVVEAAGHRIRVAGDILEYSYMFVADDAVVYDPGELAKGIGRDPDAARLLEAFRHALSGAAPFEAEVLERVLRDFVADQKIKMGQIVHPLRVAVTGTSVGFGLFETLAILGKERCLARIDRALAQASRR
jgi:glutamyl-tRNA synthetase